MIGSRGCSHPSRRLGLTGGCRFIAGKKVCQCHPGRSLLSISLAGSAALAKQRTINYSEIVNPTIATSNKAIVPKQSECQFGLWRGPPAMKVFQASRLVPPCVWSQLLSCILLSAYRNEQKFELMGITNHIRRGLGLGERLDIGMV